MNESRVIAVLARIIVVLALVGNGKAVAATVNAASTSFGAVQAALNTCVNGDTLVIPSGTNLSWSNQLVINKNITIKGGGPGVTYLRKSTPKQDWHGLQPIFLIQTSGAWKVQNITFDGNSTSGGKGIVVNGGGWGRITQCKFIRCWDRGVQTFSTSIGVIDHCFFQDCWSSASFYGDQFPAWTRALGLGSTNCWVFEDNYDLKTGSSFSPVGSDGAWGARYVWRYNILSNQVQSGFDYAIDAHGNQGSPFGSSSSIAGTVFTEVYNNLFSIGNGNRGNYLRGGTSIHYNNAFKATGGNMLTFGTVWMMTEEDGYRNGSPIKTNWPAYQQITNTYLFGNTFNGVPCTAANVLLDNPGTSPCLNPAGCGADWGSDGIFIQQWRDWFLTDPSTNFYVPLRYPHPRVIAENDPVMPGSFTLSSPANGATSIPVDTALSWNASSLHTHYQLLVSSNYYFTKVLWDITISPGSTSYGGVPAGILNTNTTYWWKMVAVGTNGVNTSTDAPWRFTTDSGGPATVPGSIQLATNAYSINEDAGPLVVTVKRVGGTDGIVGVTYDTSDGTALNGVNYTDVNGTESWGAGVATDQTFDIPIIDDGVFTSDKTFTITLSSPTGGATLGSPSTATVTVINTDAVPVIPLMPGLSAYAYEGLISAPGLTNAAGEFYQPVETALTNGGRVAWRFNLPTTNLYRVYCEVRAPNPSANSFGVDFNNDPMASPTAVWSINPLTADTGLETRYVDWLGNGTSTSQFITNTWALDAGTNTLYFRGREANTFLHHVTIEAVPVPGLIQLSASAYSVAENAVALTLLARRVSGDDGIVSATYSLANITAIAGVNYAPATGVLTWQDGDSEDKPFNILIRQDGVVTGDLTFRVTLSAPSGAGLGDPSTAIVTINNTDVPPAADPGVIQFAASVQSVNEDAGTATVSVRRITGDDGAVGVTYQTQAISAVDGVNFTGVTNTLSWVDQDSTNKTFNISILNDGVHTTNLTLRVILSTPTGSAILGSPTTNTITILNTNPPVVPPVPQQVKWSSTGEFANEGTTMTFTVQRISGTNGIVSVQYTTQDGTAISGTDYTGEMGTLSFAEGETSIIIEITLAENTVYQADKFFQITLFNPINCTIIDPATIPGNIKENDSIILPAEIRARTGIYRRATLAQ